MLDKKKKCLMTAIAACWSGGINFFFFFGWQRQNADTVGQETC